MKNLLSISGLTREEIIKLVEVAEKIKAERRLQEHLCGKNILLLFEKPSLRTRLSFEIAIKELGANSYYLGSEAGFAKREAIKDMAKVLTRYIDACIIRTFEQENIFEFAKHSDIVVINALSDLEHPCQVLSDLLTIKEKIGQLENFKLAFIGDGNNVCHSLIQAAGILGFRLSVATPAGYEPKKDIVEKAQEKARTSRAKIEILNDPKIAIKGADFIYTDVWVSMGWEKEREQRLKDFAGFQVNEELLSNIRDKEFFIMHCLPAHRGEEISDEVIDGENSLVYDQAENRLHMHKAILLFCLSSNWNDKR